MEAVDTPSICASDVAGTANRVPRDELPIDAPENNVAGIAENYFIMRHKVPLIRMNRLEGQRPIDPGLVADIRKKMEDTPSLDERFAWPITAIVNTTDPAVIEAIQNKEDMLDEKWEHVRYGILDGQHRQKAAIDLLNEKNEKGRLRTAKEYYWYCDIYRKDVKDVAPLSTLRVALNTPSPSRNSVAADYVRAFASMGESQCGKTNVEVLFGKPQLTAILVSLYESRFWNEFFNWSVMPFNQYMGPEVLESWYNYRPEYEILRYLVEDSTKQIHVLYKAKNDKTDPLMTADISLKEWTINTTFKTGTHDAIHYHYGNIAESRNTFDLRSSYAKFKFDQFWALAINGRYIFGDLLWISSDLEISPNKSDNQTCGQSSFLVPPMRGALSILAVLLFGADFKLDVKGNKQWIETMMNKAGVEYSWVKCKMIIRFLVENLKFIQQMFAPRDPKLRDPVLLHVEAGFVGVRDAMKLISWSEKVFRVWSDALKICKTVLGVDKNPAVWSLVSEIVFKSSSPLPPPLPSPSTEKRAVRVTAAQAFSLPAAGEPGSVRFCEEHKSTIRPQEANTAITGAAGSSSAITGAMITQANTEAVMTRVTATAATSRAIPTGAVITSAKSTAINTWIAAGNAKLMTIAASAANTRSTVAGAVINIQHKSEEIVPKKRTRDALETSPEPVTKQAKHSQNHTASTASQPGPYPSLQEEDDMDAIPTAQPQYQMNVESQQTSKVVDEKPNFDDKVMDPSNSEELKRRKRNMLSILSDLDKRVGSLGDEQANEEKTTVVESILQEAFDRIERVFISSSSEKCSYST
ncbi:hypothetical protein M408DRAFT_30515 [Serendipita vermifera MAFF 305830]|uniref:Uncharacterized protein n=1 Tax=Serendipita vermifera MAFF 305830 TaxID=933852 RepID=A0A0C3ALV4_SERVB|nr:hypothetical protein M408DRAFT_30515 [Serendipita vermifera MAFF 305830]